MYDTQPTALPKYCVIWKDNTKTKHEYVTYASSAAEALCEAIELVPYLSAHPGAVDHVLEEPFTRPKN